MRAHVQITLAYLVLCHLLLYGTSPSYKHELRRLGSAALGGVHKLSFGYIGTDGSKTWRLHPKSGLYRSTELLDSVQQGMTLNATSGMYTAKGLVAYMSATDAIKGQGWKARATLFVQLMAPRYTLLPFVHPSLKPQLQLFSLAAADLPAVARLAGSEDPRVGFRLTCTSPAMTFSLGPQPIANCSVWPAGAPAAAAQPTGSGIKAAAAGSSTCRMCPASLDLYRMLGMCMSCPAIATCHRSSNRGSEAAGVMSHSSSNAYDDDDEEEEDEEEDGVANVTTANGAQQHQEPLAFWIIVPTSFDVMPTATAEVAGAAVTARAGSDHTEQQDISSAVVDRGQLPLLGGAPYYEPPPGGLLSMMASCDAWFIFPRTPLVRLLPAMTGLQQLMFAQAVATYTFLDLLHIITAMQLLHTHMRAQDPFMARGRALGTAACSVAGQLFVLLVVRLVVSTLLAFGGVMLLYQFLRAASFASVVLQLPMLKLVAVMMRLKGLVFGATAAAAAGSGTASAAASSAQVGAAALEASSRLWGITTGLGKLSMSDATARAAAGLGVDAAGTQAAAGALRSWVSQWLSHLLAMHQLCEDVLMLQAARLVWELQEILFAFLWKFLGTAAWEAQALLEAIATMIAMLAQGSSWRAAWTRFSQLQQMQQQRRADAAAAGGNQNRVQAQVFLPAPADMGQAAEALRHLADELEQLGARPLGLFSGGTRPRRQILGQHWPTPLQLPFDAEDIQAELGIEVPRGFICPITQDIMKLPALLISSSVAVPATYDRDAIARWLQQNRRDPKSRQVLASDAQLVPNMDLYRAIEDWVAEKQALRNQQAAAAAAQVETAAGATLMQQHDALEPDAAADTTAAAMAAGVVQPQPVPSRSAGAVCSGLITAVRGAAAVVRQTRSLSLGHANRRGTARAAAAAAAEDADSGPLLSDEEVEGPVAAGAAQPAAAEDSSAMHRYLQRRQRRQQQRPGLGLEALPPAADAGAGRVVGGTDNAAGTTQVALQEQQQQQQPAPQDGNANSAGTGRRYHLRSSRSSTPAQE